ncbi:MAG: LysR family transcriptional regulator [Clostridia bacterium]|nr:LysR family transcriptional regulator [Clostridia bacterium]
MEFRVMKYFLTVAREENITRAAQYLHITQPTLSRQLMQLEEELGVKLFIRSNHSITLTNEGMLLKRRAEEMLELYGKTKEELSGSRQNLSGEIAIGFGETQNIIELSKIMVAFREKYPDVTFDFHTGIASDIKERIENGLIDIGLLIEPVDISKYHFIKMPRREKWCVLLRKDSPLARKDRIAAKDLVGIPLITAKRKSVQNELENWFGEYYKKLTIIATNNVSYSNRSIMVANHMGAALVLEFDCTNDDVCLRPLYPEILNGSFLVWKKNQPNSVLIGTFIDFTKKCVAGMVNDSI